MGHGIVHSIRIAYISWEILDQRSGDDAQKKRGRDGNDSAEILGLPLGYPLSHDHLPSHHLRGIETKEKKKTYASADVEQRPPHRDTK